jgi:flavin-dependent dehydrogenase
MWMVQRDKFDHFLAQQAQQQGATLQEQTEVLGLTRTSQSWQVKTAQAMLEARYLIAADGVNSICAKWLGFAPHTSFMGASLEISSLQGSLSPDRAYFDFGSLKNGYIWVFPKKKGYSISGGCFKGNLKSEELKKQLYHYAQQQGLDTAQAQYQEYPLNLWTENQPLHTDKALLAGEAAGLLDPLLGEGIRPAILSGVRAAEAINRALAGQETALAQYTQILTDEWGKEMSLAQKLAGIFYQFPQVAYKVALKRPAAAQLMGQILCGQLRYSDVTEQVMQTLKKKLIPGFGR